ncbi:MAG: transposase [Endomicrobiales bacterium]|nr:transposase [Endomicrobiales bacterium]
MARISRLIAVGLPHHITQRGNNKQKIFIDDSDRKYYISLVNLYCNKYNLPILVFCLMNNHVHFIAVPSDEHSIAKVFSTVHMRYAQYFNKKSYASGHLWQGRFYSCILDYSHLIIAARYIERNPVRASLAKNPWDWEWSSAGEHVGYSKSKIKLGDLFEYADMSTSTWREYITGTEEEQDITKIRKHTLRDLPIGSDKFLKELDLKTGKNIIKRINNLDKDTKQIKHKVSVPN